MFSEAGGGGSSHTTSRIIGLDELKSSNLLNFIEIRNLI